VPGRGRLAICFPPDPTFLAATRIPGNFTVARSAIFNGEPSLSTSSGIEYAKRRGEISMNTKKNVLFFIFVFPIALVIGILLSLALSLQFEEDVRINWFIAVAVGVLLDLVLTWRNSNDAKERSGSN
jgi:hypothetical protein